MDLIYYSLTTANPLQPFVLVMYFLSQLRLSRNFLLVKINQDIKHILLKYFRK
jgi:hypothetical protein